MQYTSGSTALPKGVQVSHGNLVANELLIRHGFGIDLNPDDVIVSWLPLYHDMGLIGGLLQPIFSSVPCVLMSPAYFLGRPLRWLEAISEYGGTISGGPDFAYRLCSERVSESALERLDLSGWRVAYSGSEPIRLDTLERFAEKFSTCGFSADSFMASYGLAEATLFVAGTARGKGIGNLRVDDQALAQNRVEVDEGSPIMSCGISQPAHAVLIIDPVSLSEQADNVEGMLLHTLLEPGTGLYYMQDRYRINSELDPLRFAQAWQAVIARHEALRASFCWNVGEDMLQVIHKPGSTPIEYFDWSDLAEAEQEPKLQTVLKTEREAGFDLLNQAPFHLRLIRVGAARYWFMMSNHHILIDAWCRSLLMNDFFEIYSALGEGREAQLAVPPRYRDYIGWLQHQSLAEARK